MYDSIIFEPVPTMANDTTFQGEFGGNPKMFPHPDWQTPQKELPPDEKWCGRCDQSYETTGPTTYCPGCASDDI